MAITDARHPFGPSQMTLMSPLRPDRLGLWIDMQNNPRHLAPIGAFGIDV
jgi:hypothetical protein